TPNGLIGWSGLPCPDARTRRSLGGSLQVSGRRTPAQQQQARQRHRQPGRIGTAAPAAVVAGRVAHLVLLGLVLDLLLEAGERLLQVVAHLLEGLVEALAAVLTQALAVVHQRAVALAAAHARRAEQELAALHVEHRG